MNPSRTVSPTGAPTGTSRHQRPEATARLTVSLSRATRTKLTISASRWGTPSAAAWARAVSSSPCPLAKSTDWRTACTARPTLVPARPRRHGSSGDSASSLTTWARAVAATDDGRARSRSNCARSSIHCCLASGVSSGSGDSVSWETAGAVA